MDLRVRCRDCKRPLMDEVSRAHQLGPVCRERAGIVVTAAGSTRTRRRDAVADQLELDLEETCLEET